MRRLDRHHHSPRLIASATYSFIFSRSVATLLRPVIQQMLEAERLPRAEAIATVETEYAAICFGGQGRWGRGRGRNFVAAAEFSVTPFSLPLRRETSNLRSAVGLARIPWANELFGGRRRSSGERRRINNLMVSLLPPTCILFRITSRAVNTRARFRNSPVGGATYVYHRPILPPIRASPDLCLLVSLIASRDAFSRPADPSSAPFPNKSRYVKPSRDVEVELRCGRARRRRGGIRANGATHSKRPASLPLN